MLYRNAAGTQLFFGKNWYIGEVSHINTPDSLVAMYADYTDEANPLLWNGGEDGIWSAQETTTEELPGLATGWDVYVDAATGYEGYYHSYAADGRAVSFGSHSDSQDVRIVGTVMPGSIEIAEGDYRFTDGGDARIEGSGTITVRTGASLTTEADIGTRDVHVEAEAAFRYEASADTEMGAVYAERSAEVSFGNSSDQGEITYTVSSLTNAAGTLNIGNTTDLFATHVVTAGSAEFTALKLASGSSLSSTGTVSILGSLTVLQTATTYSLRNAVQNTVVDADLDLTSTEALTLESAVSLNGHSLLFSTTDAITLNLPYELTEGMSFTLFEDIGSLSIDGSIVNAPLTFRASELFTGDYISDAIYLQYTAAETYGTLSLVHAVIPEPGSISLFMVAIVAAILRRRR